MDCNQLMWVLCTCTCMLNTVNNDLADVSSISPLSVQMTFCAITFITCLSFYNALSGILEPK